MSWLRNGDNAATHPRVMSAYEKSESDDRAINEVFGFVQRCALQSASHSTDYVVDLGTALMLGGAHTERLLGIAERCGLLIAQRGKSRTWKVYDDPEFIHMRTRAELEWEAQRKADNSNVSLTVPVRLRDGDACRYCGSIVKWTARRGKLAATYDHREPGRPGTVDTLVVACSACNAGRRDDPEADERYPLREAPPHPFFSPSTAEWLGKHGHDVEASSPVRPVPTSRKPAGNQQVLPDGDTSTPAERLPAESGNVGSGRVGSGRSGSGRVGSRPAQDGSGGAAARGTARRRSVGTGRASKRRRSA